MVGPGAIVWILSVAVGVVAEKITVIQDTSTIAATEGDTVILPCSHNATDHISANRWFKGATNGMSVSNYTGEYRGRVFRLKVPDAPSTDMDASMQLNNVRINDSGLYICQVKTITSEACGTGTFLTVNGVDAEKIAVIQDTSIIVATEGDTVILPCSHNATDHIWANRWFKGATNGMSVSNYTGEYRGRVKAPDAPSTDMDVSIQLNNVRINDSGLYVCQVKTMMSEACGTGTFLTVNAGRNKFFTVKQGQSRIVADEGQAVLMSCTHNANRSRGASEYSWHKDGKQVSNETQDYAGRVIGPIQDDSFNPSIQLVDVRQSDSGDYYCKVRIEGLGEAEGEGVSLEVNGTGKIKSATIRLRILALLVALEGCILLVIMLLVRQSPRDKRKRYRSVKTHTSSSGTVSSQLFRQLNHRTTTREQC